MDIPAILTNLNILVWCWLLRLVSLDRETDFECVELRDCQRLLYLNFTFYTHTHFAGFCQLRRIQ